MTKQTILIVDDISDYQTIMKLYLRSFTQIEVVEASNGLEAIKAIEKLQPIGIFTDTNMPQMCGIELLEWCGENHPSIPVVVFFSGSEKWAHVDAKHIRELGALAVLRKPYSREEIETYTQKMLMINVED